MTQHKYGQKNKNRKSRMETKIDQKRAQIDDIFFSVLESVVSQVEMLNDQQIN